MRPDSSGLETFRRLKIKLLKMQTFKQSFSSGKPLVIDGCCLVSRSNYLNNSNKDRYWLISACFIREQMHADATFSRLENRVWFENAAQCVGKSIDSSFDCALFCCKALRKLPACFKMEQITVEASLFVNSKTTFTTCTKYHVTDWLTDWLTGWLAGRPTDRPTDWLFGV